MRILAINPWIYDFAAYDFWLKPYGFLVLLSYLKTVTNAEVGYIDCLDKKLTHANFGRGKYPDEIIEKPELFKNVPRYFKRYGITKEEFIAKLPKNPPDYILLTSSMTYWYPALVDIVKILKDRFSSPIILGGTYATLCKEHAKKTIACDKVFANQELEDFFKVINVKFNPDCFYATLPDYKYFYRNLEYVVLRTSWGCPFECSFCAIKKLFPLFFRLKKNQIITFIKKYAEQGITDLVLYDDAFLYQPDYAKCILNQIIKLNKSLRIHTPNALHLRYLDKELSTLLKQSGFLNPHFGLETMDKDLQKQWGDKVNLYDVEKGITALKQGGFKNGEFSVYLLLGYPNQNLTQLKKDATDLHALGAKISLAEFSPVPHTRLFCHYQSEFAEPLMQNNSIFGSLQKEKIQEFWEIKNFVRELNKNW